MKKHIDTLVTNGWTITFEPAIAPKPTGSIILTASKGGMSSVRFGRDSKSLLKSVFADCVEREPKLAADWYN